MTGHENLHHQVAHALRDKIVSGQLRDGQALPSTRELAQQWQVSVFTITEAMKTLSREGLVVSTSRSKRVVHFPDEFPEPTALPRPTPPVALLIGGYAGCGKTELARILSRRCGWPMLDKDTMTRPTAEVALELLGQSPNDRESPPYLSRVRPREYEALLAAGHENVECGNSVIMSAPFVREFVSASWLERTRATFHSKNARCVAIWIRCDAESMHMYLRQRGAARDAYKLAHWHEYLASIDVDFVPAGPHLAIDNSTTAAPLQLQADRLLAELLDQQTSRTTVIDIANQARAG